MHYAQLVELYFERSTALQNYWTLYVVIIGGLLAFSSLRQIPNRLTTILVLPLMTCSLSSERGVPCGCPRRPDGTLPPSEIWAKPSSMNGTMWKSAPALTSTLGSRSLGTAQDLNAEQYARARHRSAVA